MKIKNKKVYYCEFCKKHSLSISSMNKHEKHCIKNLDRVCRLCKILGGEPLSKKDKLEIIEKIKSMMSYPQGKEEYGINTTEVKQPDIKEIIKMVSEKGWEGCPNCLLSIIVFTGLQKFPYHIDWDYKKELKNTWYDINWRREDQ